MSAIDQVIARARMAGDIGFTERRKFKLARARAVEKLRRFALADPYFYILELIQAAVASEAKYIDIGCGEGKGDEVRVSWTGGRPLLEGELGQLFDFLFASKERLDLAHVRSLALGVNALLLFAPSSIVIESGDGTPEGTARMVIRQSLDQVEVGRAAGALNGTYVKVFGLDRAKVAREIGRHGENDGGLEYATIEIRCLAAPVPILFNGQSVFGWSRQKIARPFGYKKIIEFDEGDLYGALGLDPEGSVPSFQLLTHGVWVQTYEHPLLAPHKLGGIVCFDRLHKTVDHSGFVRDDVFDEMWLRMRPYAEQLIGGKADALPKIANASGVAYSLGDLRSLLAEVPRVLVIDPELPRGSRVFARAEALANLLDAELLRVPEVQRDALRVFGGRGLMVWRPDLREGTDELFYAQDSLPEPSGPLLLPAVSLAAIPSAALAQTLVERTGLAALGDALGQTGECTATLHSPAEPPSPTESPSPAEPGSSGLQIRILTVGRRLIIEHTLASAWSGRVIDVVLPTCSPTRLLELGSEAVVGIAEHFATLAGAVLIEQDRRALAGLGVGEIEVGSPAARLALQVLARALVTRLRSSGTNAEGSSSPRLGFSLLHAPPKTDPLELPLLVTLAGTPLSLRDLAELAERCGGLIYGVIPEVGADLAGLDRDRVLALDLELERLLLGLVGEASYVRVDARDVLARAEIDGREFVVRDMALGLREYPEFPLLIEGSDPTQLDEAARAELLDRLLGELRARVMGKRDDPNQPAEEREEHRRQAIRHLQWLVCRSAANGTLTNLPGLEALPLFLDLDGVAWSLAALLPVLDRGELIVHYAHGLGANELGSLAAAIRDPSLRAGPDMQPESLAISAFALHQLALLGRVRLACDFDLDDHEAARGPSRAREAFLVREEIEVGGARCLFGIPATPTPESWLPICERDEHGTRVVGLIEPPIRGVVGSIEIDARMVHPGLIDQLERELPGIGERLLDRLLARLPELDEAQTDPRRNQALQIAFDYAGDQLTLIGERGQLRVSVGSALADRVLGLPVFDLGGPTLVPAQRLIEQFRRRWTHAEDPLALPPFDWSAVVAADTAKPLRVWLERQLNAARVSLPASKSTAPSNLERPTTASERPRWPSGRRLDAASLGWNLGQWLDRLRPDPRSMTLEPESNDEPVVPQRPSLVERKPTRVWVVEIAGSARTRFEALKELVKPAPKSGRMINGNDERIQIDFERPMVMRMLLDPIPANFAWLLLATYAHLNEVTVAITNAHEQEFQRRVAAALLDGTLTLWIPPDARA